MVCGSIIVIVLLLVPAWPNIFVLKVGTNFGQLVRLLDHSARGCLHLDRKLLVRSYEAFVKIVDRLLLKEVARVELRQARQTELQSQMLLRKCGWIVLKEFQEFEGSVHA